MLIWMFKISIAIKIDPTILQKITNQFHIALLLMTKDSKSTSIFDVDRIFQILISTYGCSDIETWKEEGEDAGWMQ